MKARSQEFKYHGLDIVGSATYGRYPKVSSANTYNMIESDGFLVDFAGYTDLSSINSDGTGRGFYSSSRGGFMIAVIYNVVYQIDNLLTASPIFKINTFSGNVSIDEDINGNIAICDSSNLWIYNWPSGKSYVAGMTDAIPSSALDFIPNYVTFQDGRFVVTGVLTQTSVNVPAGVGIWRLSATGTNAIYFPADSQHQGQFQTKPDTPVAALRFPGSAGLLFIFGSVVTELWYDAGLQLFPYQRSNSININYGCLNSDTISSTDNIVCWLGGNENSGPVIMYSLGGEAQQLSTDGINFKLANLEDPMDSHGFMFKQDGHILYVLTFPTDNWSICYDFTTKKFFTITDPVGNYFPAQKVVFYNNNYYFVSLNDGNLHLFSSTITNYNGNNIPRIRVTETLRMADQSQFVTSNISFVLEQGVDGVTQTEDAVVDLAISNDGGQTFGNFVRMQMNPIGYRKNKFIYWNLGWSNEITFQFRFYSYGRIVCSNGQVSYYQ